MQRDQRMVLGKAPDDRRQYRRQERLLASDPQVSDLRVSEVFDIPPALLQLIERRDASPVQRGAVYRWIDTPRAAIEKPHAVTVFEVGDRFGHGGLGNAELLGRFRHAARLHDRKEHMQVTELETSPELTVPVDLSHHRTCPM